MSDDNLDFFADAALVADPYAFYDELRECPVQREHRHGVVMVSGYDEVSAVCRDDRFVVTAGAGVVEASDPASEAEETRNKARGVLCAIEAAGRTSV